MDGLDHVEKPGVAERVHAEEVHEEEVDHAASWGVGEHADEDSDDEDEIADCWQNHVQKHPDRLRQGLWILVVDEDLQDLHVLAKVVYARVADLMEIH